MSRREDPKPTVESLARRVSGQEHRVGRALQAMVVAVVFIIAGFGLTGWQINRTFDSLEGERTARVDAQSSINAYFCREIDKVGDGVAALVAVSLANSPPREELTPRERVGFDRFAEYLREQRRPPRCHQVALKLARLTGADPADVVITPLRIHPQR